jgi:DNA-binding transcriptional LysR family regulator
VDLDTRIPLQKLEVFALAVELESVSRAAERLFIAQPAVTAHIHSLEQRLGAELLYRDGRRMRPTEAGETVYRWAQDVLTRSRELAREIGGLADGTRGSAVIATSMSAGSYLLPTILSHFQQQHPGANLTLGVSNPELALRDVESGQADLALVIEDIELISSPQVRYEQLGEEDLVLVTAPDGEPSEPSVPIERLATLPFICSPAALTRREMEDRRLREHGVARENIVIALGHPEAMKRAAIDGLGATLLFRSAVRQELDHGRLREVAINDARLRVPILLVYRRSKRFSPLQQQLIEAIRTQISD